MKLQQNVGGPDRIVRVLLGTALAYAFVTIAAPWSWVASVLAVIMLVTGATGFCPLYALLRIRTCPIQRA